MAEIGYGLLTMISSRLKLVSCRRELEKVLDWFLTSPTMPQHLDLPLVG